MLKVPFPWGRMEHDQAGGDPHGRWETTSVAPIIVLADDEPDLRSIYATSLRREGYEVWEASDGREALELVAAHQPALLLLDVWMPTLNGLEVVDQLRNHALAGQLRVIMLSNLSDSDTRLEGF